MTTITRRYRFCASHRLHSDALSEAENDRTYGKCNNPFGHGHDYVLDVSVTGKLDAATGLIVKLGTLDTLVDEEVLSVFDYRNLNHDIAEFSSLVPTTENVTLVIADRLRKRWTQQFPYAAARLKSISMFETDRNSFEVVLPVTTSSATPAVVDFNESVIINA